MARGLGMDQSNPKIGQRTIEMLSSTRLFQAGTMTKVQRERMQQLFTIKYIKSGDMPRMKDQTDM